ncbi:dihydroflavonol 4-reductase [Lunatimonas lonarensis]|uniref:Dihydroflavonol 4-reductase n=1 Tax=Lunatimonas lonarensis TaxID=1232681 RepID=R7ZYH0_9BACT|nr:NAD-dependent epimerase/dehydratase family protein [Lunatimonas lonarensis]EON79130.1 dihydroflavonol 4-reductase [Lunatimonas lonarensis]
MKILITGITGLLGSYLANQLTKVGTVYGFRRRDSNLHLLGSMATQIEWHEGDLNDFQSLEEAIIGKDMVVHAAGLLPYASSSEEDFLKVNTEGTANLVNAMLSSQAGRLVYISSATALGVDPDTQLINEQYKWTPSELNSPHAVSKHLAELEVWRGAQEGLKVMVFNPTTLLPKLTDLRSSAHLYRHLSAPTFRIPKGNISYIDIRDASDVILQMIEKAPWDARYILNSESISFESFTHQWGKAMNGYGSEPIRRHILRPYWERVWNPFSKSKAYGRFDGLQKTLADRTIVYDNEKVQRLIGFGYRPLKETLTWALGNKSKTVPV